MISRNKVPCKVVYFNQQTKQKTRLIGEIDEERWLKFKKIVELLFNKKLIQKNLENKILFSIKFSTIFSFETKLFIQIQLFFIISMILVFK